MKPTLKTLLSLGILLFATGQESFASAPIEPHPANPHYFEYKGQPTLLITSAEQYGAVLNLDFYYKIYLKTSNQTYLQISQIII